MKKRFLIPALALGLALAGCKDSHTVKKDAADMTVVKTSYIVGNTEQQKKHFLNEVLYGYNIINKEEYEANYTKVGHYTIRVNNLGKLVEFDVEVKDVTLPEISMSVISFEAHTDTQLTEEYFLSFCTFTDDTTEDKNLIKRVVDGNELDGYFRNWNNTSKIGHIFTMSCQCYDEAGNGAFKSFTVKIVD